MNELAVRRRSVTVTALDAATSTCTVTYADGVTTTAAVPYLSSYLPAVGDVALLDLVAGSPLLIGRPGGADSDMVEFQPGGNLDTGASASFATWITLGSVTVPAWATHCRYQVTVAGVIAVTATAGLTLRLAVGGVGGTGRATTAELVAGSPLQDYGWAGRITSTLTAGSQSVAVQYIRTSGTGAMRAGVTSLITAVFGWET